jgi:hypothetical protein
MKKKALYFFETQETSYPMTEYHIVQQNLEYLYNKTIRKYNEFMPGFYI